MSDTSISKQLTDTIRGWADRFLQLIGQAPANAPAAAPDRPLPTPPPSPYSTSADGAADMSPYEASVDLDAPLTNETGAQNAAADASPYEISVDLGNAHTGGTGTRDGTTDASPYDATLDVDPASADGAPNVSPRSDDALRPQDDDKGGYGTQDELLETEAPRDEAPPFAPPDPHFPIKDATDTEALDQPGAPARDDLYHPPAIPVDPPRRGRLSEAEVEAYAAAAKLGRAVNAYVAKHKQELNKALVAQAAYKMVVEKALAEVDARAVLLSGDDQDLVQPPRGDPGEMSVRSGPGWG